MKRTFSIKKLLAVLIFGFASFNIFAQATPKDFVIVKPDQVVWGDAPAGVARGQATAGTS